VPLSVDHRTAVDLDWRKVKDKGCLYFIHTTKFLRMACHESIKELLHKTLGLNGTGFPDRLCDDQSDSRDTLEISSTVETATNMLS